MILVASAAVAGCTPAQPPPSPIPGHIPNQSASATAVAVSCGQLSKRDCEGYVESARVALGAPRAGLGRIVADAGCPVEGMCNPPADAWVVFVYSTGGPSIAAVMRGDPSGPPAVTPWTGPLPSMP